jgi:hypothetical protein
LKEEVWKEELIMKKNPRTCRGFFFVNEFSGACPGIFFVYDCCLPLTLTIL